MRICANTLPQIAEYARSGRVVVFDTETTGCSRYDEICQIAAVEYVNGVQTRTFNSYICPSCEMNPWAEGVHGLSLDFLSEHGLAPEEASHFGTFGSMPPRGGSTTTVVRRSIGTRRMLCPTRPTKNLAFSTFCETAFRFANSTACRPLP